MVDRLDECYPGIGDRLLEPDGSLRGYFNVFVDGDPIRCEGEAAVLLNDPAEAWIMSSIAGAAAHSVGGSRRCQGADIRERAK